MALNDRSYVAGRFSLDVDGYNAGYLKKFSGLSLEADIAVHDLGVSQYQTKNVSNIKWTPGKATIGIGMGKGMYDWIHAAFSKNALYKTGSLTAADFDYKATSRMDFSEALITGVTVPKLSGDSKEAAYFDVEFEAERVRWSKGGGEDIRGKIGPVQKAWLCSNFRLELGGLPTDRSASIDSFTWKCSVVSDMLGLFKEHTKHPAKVVVPDLKLSLSYADYQPWADAAKKWFIDGQHLDRDEMEGRIVFLGPDMKQELGEVTLHHVGFKKFSTEDVEANSEKIKRFNVELYVEHMDFKINLYDE